MKVPIDAQTETAVAPVGAPVSAAADVPAAPLRPVRPSWLRRHWLQVVVHVGCLLPLLSLLWGVAHEQFYNSGQAITARTGRTSLVLLLLALACTPAASAYGFKQATLVRRPLGLYAFFYAALHMVNWAFLDERLSWSDFVAQVANRVDLQVAIVAVALMIPLALTSTKGWMRRLGRNWKLLHRLVYVAAALSIAHFYLLGTNRASEPLRYAFILAALLVLRLPPVRRAVWNFLH